MPVRISVGTRPNEWHLSQWFPRCPEFPIRNPQVGHVRQESVACGRRYGGRASGAATGDAADLRRSGRIKSRTARAVGLNCGRHRHVHSASTRMLAHLGYDSSRTSDDAVGRCVVRWCPGFSRLPKTNRLKAIHQRWCPNFCRWFLNREVKKSPEGYTPARAVGLKCGRRRHVHSASTRMLAHLGYDS
jgi:hypothetical protein